MYVDKYPCGDCEHIQKYRYIPGKPERCEDCPKLKAYRDYQRADKICKTITYNTRGHYSKD